MTLKKSDSCRRGDKQKKRKNIKRREIHGDVLKESKSKRNLRMVF